jgi:hypothetical protein
MAFTGVTGIGGVRRAIAARAFLDLFAFPVIHTALAFAPDKGENAGLVYAAHLCIHKLV